MRMNRLAVSRDALSPRRFTHAVAHAVACLTVALALPAVSALAQAPKKVLTQADWDTWKSINAPALSNDGKWAVYTLVPQVGDGDLVIRSTTSNTEYRVPRGFLGRPNNTPGGLRGPQGGTGEEAPVGPTASPATISADSRFVIVSTQPNQAEVEHAPRGRGAAANRQSMAIVSLADGKVTTVENVRSFRMAPANGTWLAYVAQDSAGGEGAPAAGAAPAGGRGGRGGRGGNAGSAGGGNRRQFGSTLVLRNLGTGAEERIADVLTFAFDDSARVLGYTVVSRDSTKDGAFVRNIANGTTSTLLSGHGDYKGLTFDRTGTQIAFVSDRDEFGQAKPRYTLYTASVKGGAAQVALTPAQVTTGMHIAENSAIAFTHSGTAITFAIGAPAIDSVPADSLVGKAVFDLWNYKDQVLQPTQRINAQRDRNKTYAAVYYPSLRKFVRLADDSIPTVALSEDAKIGVANSRERYMIEQMWGDGGTDVYVIDPISGARKLIAEKINGNAQLSPDAKFVAFYNKQHWYTYDIATAKLTDISSGVKGVHFENETDDHPSEKPAWGLAGWTKGDKSVLLNDHFDVWELDPTGVKPAVVVTDSAGIRNRIQFRIEQVGAGRGGRGGGGGRGGFGGAAGEDRALDPAEPLMLRALNTETMASGFYRAQLGQKKAPEKIVMSDLAYGPIIKAANTDEYMITKSTFVEFPNLWVGSSLTNLAKISDANPQQKNYKWGTAELVRWVNGDGKELKGILYKPENFDPNKKYPLIAYFYEILSNNLHQYVAPTGRNVINPTHYVSNGYLVFEPDIIYEDGHPGMSAYKSIVPGVQSLVAKGFVDEKHLGIQGQSWGGYQTAYVITQTHMFAAAMAGAPVVNMTSAYGGIRWGTGISRAGQYESGQSRIGKPLVDAPELYIENSPLFHLRSVTTPLFIMNNDMDDAVPWYQGIEYFVTMRRLGKEVYFIDYNNDVHNPASRANQKDIAMRMQQFFDNKLKGAAAPDWMVHGIPYVAKGKDQLGPAPVQAGGAIVPH
ncbi:MAG TPA: prolyl oligopeptidase family serine peptidase [Gemmatimonadaceae bacterium]|nr:prolyl oligopeptidase family serine peptidase [Gemmatimonadaceae bacterium]